MVSHVQYKFIFDSYYQNIVHLLVHLTPGDTSFVLEIYRDGRLVIRLQDETGLIQSMPDETGLTLETYCDGCLIIYLLDDTVFVHSMPDCVNS